MVFLCYHLYSACFGTKFNYISAFSWGVEFFLQAGRILLDKPVNFKVAMNKAG